MNPDLLQKQLAMFQSECTYMQEFLERDNTDSPEALVERVTKLNVLLARSGKLLADAKLIQDEISADVFIANEATIIKMGATLGRQYVQARTSNINYYVNWLDRLNRAMVHVGDNMRTQISFVKEELRLTKSGY